MNENEDNIIEVEAVDKTCDVLQKDKKPQKAKYQYGGRIAALEKADRVLLTAFFPTFILGASLTLLFGILLSENPGSVPFLVLLIVAAIAGGLGLLMFIGHFVLTGLSNHYKKLDPNFD